MGSAPPARTSPAAPHPLPAPARGTGLDGRQAVVDLPDQVGLLRSGRHRQAHEFVGQPNVREYAAGIVVEVKKGARLQVEDTRPHLAKHRAGAELLEKRSDAGECCRTGVFHWRTWLRKHHRQRIIAATP